MIDSSRLESLLGSKAKIRVLDVLYKYRGELLSGREVARRGSLTAARTHTILKTLVSGGIATVRVSGRNHLYSLKSDPELMSLLGHLFAGEPPSVIRTLQDMAARTCANTSLLSVQLMHAETVSSADAKPLMQVAIVVDGRTPVSRRSVHQLVEGLALASNRPVAAEVYDYEMLPQVAAEVGLEGEVVPLYGPDMSTLLRKLGQPAIPEAPRFSFRRLFRIGRQP